MGNDWELILWCASIVGFAGLLVVLCSAGALSSDLDEKIDGV